MRSSAVLLIAMSIQLTTPLKAVSVEIGLGGSYLHSQYAREANWMYIDSLIAHMSGTTVKSMRTQFPASVFIDEILNNANPQHGNEMLSNFGLYLDKCNEADIDVILLLAYGSRVDYQDTYQMSGCFTPPPALTRLPPTEYAWRMYVREMMDRFGSRLSGVEVWNEPDHLGEFFDGRVSDYVGLVRIAYEEVKGYDPSMPVATGGLACHPAVYRSYLAALLDASTGAYDYCDAVGLHFYNNSTLERLKIYYDVCREMGVTPKPIWATEFGRDLSESSQKSYNSARGERAYPEHIFELFSSYGVERAMVYTQTEGVSGYNLFDWNAEDSTLNATVKWEYYREAAARLQGYAIGETIGFGADGGADMFGISPFEDYGRNVDDDTVVNPLVESSFDYIYTFAEDRSEYPLRSFTNVDGSVLAMSFDLNDSWVESVPAGRLKLEIDVKSVGGAVELRYQSCCETAFRTWEPNTDQFDNLLCPGFLDGLSVEGAVPDYSLGVEYNTNTSVATLTVEPGVLTTVTIYLDDWMFQNGVERRADLSFVPVDNQEFEIHRVKLSPVWTVEYADKSAETQMQYTGQPRNAGAVDYDGDGGKDLLLARWGDSALAYSKSETGPSGAPIMELTTEQVLSLGNRPGAETNGFVFADFDNDGWVDFFAPNQITGGRLYRNIDGLYYQDWTSESGLDALDFASITEDAITCSWGDYDGDGYLDLAVVSYSMHPAGGARLSVLHNAGGTFDYAVVDVGDFPGYSPLWADFDNDGDLDLFVGRSGAIPVGGTEGTYPDHCFINQGDGTFAHDINRVVNSRQWYFGTIAAAVDFDNDGDIDIVGADECAVFLYENNSPWWPGSMQFWGRTLIDVDPSVGLPCDLSILDYDLDGFQDVLVGWGDPFFSPSGTTDVRLFASRSSVGGERIVEDETTVSGLFGGGKTGGFAVADYNADGLSDLYLSRLASAPFFYKASTGNQQGRSNWVGIRLESPRGANNSQGLGATVVVVAGDLIQTQVVDGGSGLASQRDADLLFGLGTYDGAVSVEVRWPNGRTQVVEGLPSSQYSTIADDSPVIDNASIQFARVFHADTGREDWVFTWETYNSSLPELDKVVFDIAGVPARCCPASTVLNGQAGDVLGVVNSPEGVKYVHTITLAGVDCEPRCTMPFTVESATPDYKTSSEVQQVRTSACISWQ